MDEKSKEVCLYNDSGACNYGVFVGVIAFLASIGFIVGEYLFEQMSSVKTRKHYVLGDLGFSGKSQFFHILTLKIGHNLLNYGNWVPRQESMKNIYLP